ncbi:TetR/AcrR family transcriptional regulator [Desulfospira joergensenii]|uniref:TetR/AcrR family transcriptional regulator n=1 Tax=Desulfospira joergensenii TaxID=53329 RepID=UPI0003B41455|nr:TetR/AcrR family transcriptional regulator [Desulfospira joergensenii]
MTDTKEIIKKAAINLFYKKSYFATAMSNIALDSNIRKASIYHHYASKEDILFDILMSTMEDLTATIESSLQGIENIENRMRAAVRAHVKFHCDRQQEVLIADSELRGLTANNFKSFVAKRDAYEKIFQEMLVQGMDQGYFAAGDAKVISYAILTMCTAVAIWFNSEGRLTGEQISHIYEELVVTRLLRESLPLHAFEDSAVKE